ncbi:hypothetical protein ABT236_38070, partial [Streptomyces sp. NPDC001523]|uniref:hypothetical protein n=1 Tax=Streptomyces sp. NPDC001523 TaxID=3154383 RepID=UPI00332767D3
HGYLAPVIAYMTAVGMTRRPRWRVALWVVLLWPGGGSLRSPPPLGHPLHCASGLTEGHRPAAPRRGR